MRDKQIKLIGVEPIWRNLRDKQMKVILATIEIENLILLTAWTRYSRSWTMDLVCLDFELPVTRGLEGI